MKRRGLTKEGLAELCRICMGWSRGKLVGFFKGIPVIEDKTLPEGEVWFIKKDEENATQNEK